MASAPDAPYPLTIKQLVEHFIGLRERWLRSRIKRACQCIVRTRDFRFNVDEVKAWLGERCPP
jgi:hypothetical protein